MFDLSSGKRDKLDKIGRKIYIILMAQSDFEDTQRANIHVYMVR